MLGQTLTRRDWLQETSSRVLAVVPALLQSRCVVTPSRGRIERIGHKGPLISDCSLAGETRRDDTVPAHPNGIQVSRDRWLIVYATRRFRGVDDDASIAFQLRKEAPDGDLIKEAMLVHSHDEWDPLGDGSRHVKQHGHPVAFGVPRGARIGGKPAPSANVFVLKWRQVARVLDHERSYLEHSSVHPELRARTQSVEWLQFRLNEQEDDIEILKPASRLRERGYEEGSAFCGAPEARSMNQTFTQAVPFNRDCTQWADCNHFDGRVAALKYDFNSHLGLYEWVETGPYLFEPERPVSEASLASWGTDWVVAARRGGGRRGVAWVRTQDPFTETSTPVTPAAPQSRAPLTAYSCPDGVLRLFTGDETISPHGKSRDPLYCWDIDPDRDFTSSRRRVIYDSVDAGLPIRPVSSPKIDMCKLFPHYRETQYLLHRVSVRAFNHPYLGSPEIPIINEEEKASCGIHCAKITYGESFPSPWEFPQEAT